MEDPQVLLADEIPSESQGHMPSVGQPRLPYEIFDIVVDFLHNDKKTLHVCCLVCRQWLPSSRLHLFRSVFVVYALLERKLHWKTRFSELLEDHRDSDERGSDDMVIRALLFLEMVEAFFAFLVNMPLVFTSHIQEVSFVGVALDRGTLNSSSTSRLATPGPTFDEMMKRLPCLRKLFLYNTNLHWMASTTTSQTYPLEVLDFNLAEPLHDPYSIGVLVFKCSQLRELFWNVFVHDSPHNLTQGDSVISLPVTTPCGSKLESLTVKHGENDSVGFHLSRLLSVLSPGICKNLVHLQLEFTMRYTHNLQALLGSEVLRRNIQTLVISTRVLTWGMFI